MKTLPTREEVLRGYKGLTYKQSVEHQVRHWALGVPTHNPVGDECCPDFSCCNPELLGTDAMRNRFLEAHLSGDHELRHEMLMMCLGGLLQVKGSADAVYVAGDEANTKLKQ